MLFLKKDPDKKTELPYDPAVPVLDINPRDSKTFICKDIGTPVFTAALFMVAQTWRQPECPSIEYWIKKM